jgi:nitrile hydratase alpha subunit
MTEASGSGGGRAEMERRLIERSLQDDDFRQRLLADPKAAVEQELGTPLPEGVQIQAVEETPDTIYLVLPSSPAGAEGGGLSDRDLESVAGGGSSWSGCDDTSQSGTCTCGCPPGR